MRVNLVKEVRTENIPSSYIEVKFDDIDNLDDGEIESLTCELILSLIPFTELKSYLDKVVKKVALGGTLTIVDLDYWTLADSYYWGKINILNLNRLIYNRKSAIDSETIRQLIPYKLVRGKISGYDFLLEYKREK